MSSWPRVWWLRCSRWAQVGIVYLAKRVARREELKAGLWTAESTADVSSRALTGTFVGLSRQTLPSLTEPSPHLVFRKSPLPLKEPWPLNLPSKGRMRKWAPGYQMISALTLCVSHCSGHGLSVPCGEGTEGERKRDLFLALAIQEADLSVPQFLYLCGYQ